jgi:hypothetical protein
MKYCNVEHQKLHRPEHKSDCNPVRKAHAAMMSKEMALKNSSDNPFTHDIGRFWGIVETRPYMRARVAYMNELSAIQTTQAVQLHLEIAMGNLRLCTNDNTGSRDVVPGLMLRLDQDQECYDFIKWWAIGVDSHLPHLSIKDANPLEPLDDMIKLWDLPLLVSLVLVKIRLLVALISEPSIRSGQGTAPGFPGSNLMKNANVVNCQDLWPETVKIKSHIRQLYEAVNSKNAHFWPALVDPGSNLDASPDMFSPGSKEEMQMTLMFTLLSWKETFGSIQIIEAALNGKML